MFRRNMFLASLGSAPATRNNKKPLRRKPKAPLLAEQLECRVTPAAFTPGDIVIERMGTGAAALNGNSTAVFLDEYTPAGILVQSVALPTSGNNPLTSSGSATSEGLLTLSTNGQLLAVPGYLAAPGLAGVASTVTTGATPTLREVDLIDSSGSVNSSTTTTAFSGGNIRGAVTTGTGANPQIWMSGSVTGVVTNTAGGSGAGTIVSSSANVNLREVNIFGGQLFISTASGTTLRVATVGTGLPTNAGSGTINTQAALPGMGTTGTTGSVSPYAFSFVNLGSGNNFDNTGTDTLYVADNTNGIQKWFFNGTGWSLTGTVLLTGDADQGLIAVVKSPTNVVLYVTNNAGKLETLTDTSGAAGTLTATPTVIATALTNTAFRGVAFTPDAGAGTLGGFGGTISYTASTAATQVAGSATFSDLSSFNGGSLTVHLTSGGTASDTLAVGTFGNITLSGSNVLDNGTQIGTVSGGAGGTDLVITFDSVVNTLGPGNTEVTVTSGQVQDLLRAISFASSGAAGPRSVQFTVVKNGGVDANSAAQTVNVTAAAVPTVDSPSATAVTNVGATLHATLENTGGATVTDYGFFYEAGNTIDAGATKVDLGPGSPGTPPVSFLANISGLLANNTYTFEGYATNASGTGFTAQTPLTTQGSPTVTSPTATAIHATSATLGGSITATNGAAITDHGIVYSTTNTTPQINGDGVTQVSLGSVAVGAFSTPVTGLALNTKYFYAAYAINSFGTSYSPVGTFTTFANPTVAENTLAAATGGTFAITSGALSVTDPDPGEVETYTLTSLPTGGTLQLGNTPLQLNGTFTQANINSGLLSYTAGNSASSDSFTFTLSNGVGGTVGSTTFHINTIAPQTFHPGDLLVYRVGDGFGNLVSSGVEVFLDEYTTSGTLVQSIPVSDSGATPLISSGVATSEGLDSLSANGSKLLLTGYQAGLGTQTSSLASSSTTSVTVPGIPRAVGVVSNTGAIDLSTTTTQFNANNPRSATADGTTLWVVGANSGVISLPQGGSGTGTVVSTTNTNLRVIQIFGGQLYYSTSTAGGGVYSVGTGEPTSTGTTATKLPGVTSASPYGFFFANLGSGNSFNGYDTLYVADDGITVGSTTGGIEKWSYNGSTWVASGSVGAASVRGLTGVANNGTVTLYGATGSGTATGGGSIYTFADSTGAGGSITGGTSSVAAAAAANEAFRGITLVPAVASAATSKAGSLSPRQTSDTFNVPASYSDTGSLVTSVDLYVSTNGGAYTLAQTLQVSPPAASGTLSFSFTGADRIIYTFHTIAHDQAGNTESKAANLIEASTYVPDLTPPVTHVIASNPTYSFSPFPAGLFANVPPSSYNNNGVFTLNVAGATVERTSGTPAGSITTFQIFVSIDGGAFQQVATLSAGSASGSGVHSTSTTYAAQGDGLAHNYSFFSIGVDDLGVAQAVPGSPDVSFSSITFTAPLAAPSLTVEQGIAERSFIGQLDVSFNQSLTSSPPSAALTSLQNGIAGGQPGAFVALEYYGENLTSSSPALSAVTLFGGTSHPNVTLSGSDLKIDFGSAGLTAFLPGANASTARTTTTGDGWYALGIDPTGDPSNNQVYWLTFYRLLGDATGDGTVTGPVGTVGTDVNIVSAARGHSGTLLNADANGDGAVNTLDLAETASAVGHTVGATPPQNFPQFQVMAGRPGPGTAIAITRAQVQALVPSAIAAWQKAGLNAAGVQLLQKAQIEIVNLGGDILGQEFPGVIQINSTAGGFSWNVNAGSPGLNQVDLRTVLEHEMGHILGLPDNDQAGDLMDIGLGLGVSREPSAFDMAALSQALRSAGTYSAGNTLAAALAANRVTAGSYSSTQLNGAVESIFAHPASGAAQSTVGTTASALLQYASSVALNRGKPLSADDLGQELLTSDLLRDPALKKSFSL